MSMRSRVLLLVIKDFLKNPRFILVLLFLVLTLICPTLASEDGPIEGAPDPSPDPIP